MLGGGESVCSMWSCVGAAGGADTDRKERFKERRERCSNAQNWALNYAGSNGRVVYSEPLVWTERV